MDVLMLSRLQFAVATLFHFLFVPLTLGLSLLIAVMETAYVRTGDEAYRSMARFWGKLFLINFVVGVVTGITLEFQFGTNWSRYSTYVGDIFGSLLAIEATVAFFLESTFVAVWAFGWRKLSPRMHALSIWLVVLASSVSAIWIIIANSWMQHPVGYTLQGGRAELTDFLAVVTQKFAWVQIIHTLFGALILSSFFVMGVSAYKILKKEQTSLFVRSFRIAVVFALVFSILEVIEGDINGREIVHVQPAKLAALEALWETQGPAPLHILLIPDEKNERNLVEWLTIPSGLSLLAHHSLTAEVKGLKDFPRDERPPVTITFLSFRVMAGLGFLFVLLSLLAWWKRNNLEGSPNILRLMILAIPLPFIAIEAGWILTEVGRQPWIVYGMMKTADAVSPIASSQVGTTLVAFILVYSLLGVTAYSLMYRAVRKGPEQVAPKQGGATLKT